jgi:hypothetical protein
MRNIPGLGKTWFAGDTKEVFIDVLDDAGAPKLLTGATAIFTVFRGEEILIEKDAADGVEVSGSTVRVPFGPDDTIGLGGTSYEVLKYECQVTDAGQNVTTVARGLFTITADLIR